ncbi:MAG: carcinine hydrolase/isopenicillin-N N-acyltransferase family protein [Candidatus Thorarchaeota archaeon]
MSGLAGALLIPEQQKTVVFQNRDSVSMQEVCEVFYDVDCFGIRGIDYSTGKPVGLSLGVNHHGLALADTHVMMTSDPSYHILGEQILMFARDAEDGLAMASDHLKTGRHYQWGNLILADHDSVLVIEVAGDQHSVEWSERKVLRTGHHFMLDTEDELRKRLSASNSSVHLEHSSQRAMRGYDMLKDAHSTDDIFRLLKDHVPSPGQSSLCRHAENAGDLATITSHVIEIDHRVDVSRPRAVLHVAHGSPCTSEFRAIPLVFPADEETIKRALTIYRGK